mmetsp:Transcript_26847/g.88090  ORF Transcript_26847/g.88090 Transcript_26847/m.88090 type:complete len:493 (+) Transcript_26847:16-1494(+)
MAAAAEHKGFDVFIRNLPEDTRAGELAAHFSKAGKIIRPPRLNLARGFAWISFESMDAVVEATRWSGSSYGPRLIYVHAANNGTASKLSEGDGRNGGASATTNGGNNNNDGFADLHLPALCAETVERLVSPDPGGVFVDGTFGRGGHSKAMLAAMGRSGRLHAFDMDPEAIKVGEALAAEDERFVIHHAPFSSMKEVLTKAGVKPGTVAGVLLDVGISSPQFNDTNRGFRPEADGPLDLRFDTSKGMPAYDFLMTVPHEELVRIIDEYGEETGDFGGAAPRRIADAICLARSRGELPNRTKPFAKMIARVRGKESSGQQMHPAKMTFQALRIHLNDEFGEMRRGMKAAFKLLGIGGRLGLITWKFSERKILDGVVNSLEAVRYGEPLLEWYNEQPGAEPLPDGPSLENDEVVRPSERELQKNSRARQGLLHVMHKRSLPRLAHLEKRAYALPSWADMLKARAGDDAEEQERKKRKREAKEKKEKKNKKQKAN